MRSIQTILAILFSISCFAAVSNAPCVGDIVLTGSISSSLNMMRSEHQTLDVFKHSRCCFTESINVEFGTPSSATFTGAVLDCTSAAALITAFFAIEDANQAKLGSD